jgi:hypothetical protein
MSEDAYTVEQLPPTTALEAGERPASRGGGGIRYDTGIAVRFRTNCTAASKTADAEFAAPPRRSRADEGRRRSLSTTGTLPSKTYPTRKQKRHETDAAERRHLSKE